MKATKCVWQYHDKESEFQQVFDYFRFCTNETIRICSQKQDTSRFSIHKEMYFRLRGEFYSKYVYGAILCAASMLKHYRKIKRKKPDAKIPYVWKKMVTLDNRGYCISDGFIRIPIRTKSYCTIKLSSHVLNQLENTKLGSITVTPKKLVISYSREVQTQKPSDFVAVDRNLDNLTTYDTGSKLMVYNLQKATMIRRKYRTIKSHFKRNDTRIRKKIFAKYGTKEKNKVHSILHETSKKITSQNQGIILEDIAGIRNLHRKGNGRGKRFRHKMNSWSYYELQRQLEYKARWLGLPVKYVRASGTSSRCAICGSKLVPEERRMMFCPTCNLAFDRDVNAARNILARGTQLVPDAVREEVMKQSKDAEQIVLSQGFNRQIKT